MDYFHSCLLQSPFSLLHKSFLLSKSRNTRWQWNAGSNPWSAPQISLVTNCSADRNIRPGCLGWLLGVQLCLCWFDCFLGSWIPPHDWFPSHATWRMMNRFRKKSIWRFQDRSLGICGYGSTQGKYLKLTKLIRMRKHYDIVSLHLDHELIIILVIHGSLLCTALSLFLSSLVEHPSHNLHRRVSVLLRNAA